MVGAVVALAALTGSLCVSVGVLVWLRWRDQLAALELHREIAHLEGIVFTLSERQQ